LKSCRVLQDHYDDEHDTIVVHKTIRNLQDQDQDHSVQDQAQDQDQDQDQVQDQDQDRFLVSDRSCRKTDGLRPHH